MPQIVRMAALKLNVVVDLVDHHFQLAGVDSIRPASGASLEFATIYRNVLSRVRAQRKRECDFFREK